MTTKDDRKAERKPSAVKNFLSGKGPNPLPKGAGTLGPLATEFIKGVEEEVRAQDADNDARPEPSALEELAAVLRLLNDNREMLSIIESGKCASVSDLAKQMKRELPNVSRTVSKLAAYGIVGLVRQGGAAKKPVLIARLPKGTAPGDWAEAYCVVRAVTHGGLMGLEAGHLMAAENAVSSVMESAARSFDQIATRAIVKSRKVVTG